MSGLPILAAGGIVVRTDLGAATRFAVVQSARKLDARGIHAWGLPKGKLAPGEDALSAARREAVEETGHHVTVHEFLGTLVYETATRPKAVQFWRMQARGAPRRRPMRDVRAVDWLTLEDALHRLSHLRERVFLEQAGPIALGLCAGVPAGADGDGAFVDDGAFVASVPLVPAAGPGIAAAADPPGVGIPAAAAVPWVRGKSLFTKTWRWLRDGAAAPLQRSD